MSSSTPMMAQYNGLKRRHRDAILFFRLGDFYEMFGGDADEASALLGLTLTKRNGVPMCGVPYHAAGGYLRKLLKAGRRVAICEQVEPPKGGKGLARREVVEVLSPGLVVDENLLDDRRNNYIGALASAGRGLSLAHLDLSTGEFLLTSFPSASAGERLAAETERLAPREFLIQESLFEDDPALRSILESRQELVIRRCPDWTFDPRAAFDRLLRHFGVVNLKAFGLDDGSVEAAAAGALLEYAEEGAGTVLSHVRDLRVYDADDYTRLDESTIRNLELVRNLHDGGERYTLLGVLDETKTAMGGRLLRKWLLSPSRDLTEIDGRLGEVAGLYHDQQRLDQVREVLSSVLDLDRLAARVAMGKANPKDLLGLGKSLEAVLGLGIFDADRAEPISRICTLVFAAISEDPALTLTEGNLIRRGFNPELDQLLELRDNRRQVLEDYAREERSATGIHNLRIRYNDIIGYYIEITKSNLGAVPPRFIRRQSLVGGERYTTERLREIEGAINSASERIVELERDLFLRVREAVAETVGAILEASSRTARVDCVAALAFVATLRGYTRPRVFSEDGRLLIVEGRHPVVEAAGPPGEFVPNSLLLDGNPRAFALITGPNMAGKSTYLRQTALIVLMAQMGSFVPAAEAEIGIVDAIFCRVGASDNIARGESTFLVEMSETAFILRRASPRSLIIMDEVGRGTGTSDGLAIAWAVCEYLLHRTGAKTLFATHFRELTDLDHPALFNLSMSVEETDQEVVFLKKVREGPAERSYGIHVAGLAGLPASVISRAGELLSNPKARGEAAAKPRLRKDPSPQRELWGDGERVVEELTRLDVNRLTPMEALAFIDRWKKALVG